MRTFILIVSTLAMLGLSSVTVQDSKTKTITFITTAVCEQCKERIETKLHYTKGVLYAEQTLENKMLTVKFKPAIISEQQIKERLAALGYSSDTVVRDREAYLALPKCCRGEASCEPGK